MVPLLVRPFPVRAHPNRMIYSKHSSYSLDEIDQLLRAAAQRHKFGVLHVHDLQATLQQKGFQYDRACRVYDVCNPNAAFQALSQDASVSTVLPCRISVFAAKSGATIATLKPTDLLRATGIAGSEPMAQEVEKEIMAIIDEAASS